MQRCLFLQAGMMVCILALASTQPSAAQSATPISPQTPAPPPNTVKTSLVVQRHLPPAPAPTSAQQVLDQKEAERIAKLAIVNGRPYDQPSAHDQFIYYLKDSYGWPALAGAAARSLYAQARDKPDGWGQDWPGYGQRFGSGYAVSAINGNVRYGLGSLFHEDMRYIPCHGCSVKRKIGNAFLSEVTARHDVDGHRFFTVTPIVADFSGPIIANSFWYPPGHGPLDGLVATRLVLVTRIGGHLVREFILERRHKDPKFGD